MATSAFKSTTRRAPIGTSAPSTDDSPTSSSSKVHRRSRSLSRFSRPIREEIEPGVLPTPRRKFVNTVRGSGFPEISLDDLAIEFFSGKENSSEVEDESGSSRNSGPVPVKSEISPVTTSSQRRSRSVSRHHNGANSGVSEGVSATAFSQRRGRSVARRNDGTTPNAGGTTRVVSDADLRRRRSVSVARYQLSDSESDIDHSWSSTNQLKSRNINNGNSRVASFQRPTASSHRRLSRSMSQTPQLRSHDGYSSQSSALTDDDSRDARYGKKEIEKTIRAVYAQKKIDHPTRDDTNHGLYEAMRKELRSAVNEIMIELEQTMERKPSALSVHDRLHSNKSDGLQTVSTTRKNYTTKLKQPEKRKQDLSAEKMLEGQQGKDGYKIVREVLPEPKSTANAQRVSHPRKQYFEDFISNVEDTDFSSFDGERSDTSSTLTGTTKQRDGGQNGSPAGCNSLPVEMEGIKLPWLKWDGNDGGPPTSRKTMPPPTTPKTKLWDPSQDLELIQDEGSSSHGSWNPEDDSTNSSKRGMDMEKYREIERTEKVLFDSWRERSIIRSGGLFLCGTTSSSIVFHF
ncbi:hypothetical protein Ccrd_023632 [Cynara cardunculus var. scolymus]|uniref:Uncharacterized protein n=1 Tax=Cynara cardunculus var. scolymus TaxID=59895 RepID=A0A103XWE8_CYNCS|nr:hypothetical protein Ccrd_023632 [Cynara cardunculus var. scolymus]